MFFFRRKLSLPAFFPDGIDRHCHMLPGVDDGVASMDDALKLMRAMKQLGFRGAFCTPHIMQMYPNKPEALRGVFAELLEAAEEEGFALKLAAEYMIDDDFDRVFTADAPLTWDDELVLVELPQFMLPSGWMDSLCLIRERGFTPVLAHPERYARVLSTDDLLELAADGVLFQGNVGSICGYYGRRVQALARMLQSRGLYHCWGTDAHSVDMLRRVAKL